MDYLNNYSLVTVILPKESATDTLDKAFASYPGSAVMLSARGSISSNKWYSKVFPPVNPEQQVVELLVEDDKIDDVLNSITAAGHFNTFGTGAVFATKCEKALYLGDKGQGVSTNGVGNGVDIDYKSETTTIYCIAQKDKSEAIANVAMKEGAPGPTVVFGQGRGIRDRLGLLRIAISPEKELIRVVVDNYDVEPVFNAMVKEGKLDTPGMGFIYTMPVDKAYVSLASVVGDKSELASNHQIIKAIDEMKGGTSWRMLNGTAGDASVPDKKYLLDLVRLSCVTERGKGDEIVDAAIAAGAPGASIAYGIKLGSEESKGNISLSKEMEVIELTVSPKVVDEMVGKMSEAAKANANEDVYFYTQQVPKALTYLG
ncbi:MAG: P-II family nitrogen regulator [Flavobacteriales bacterium]|nr:P-II family nitrogen regulator [Flavobacteriales bacterium]